MVDHQHLGELFSFPIAACILTFARLSDVPFTPIAEYKEPASVIEEYASEMN